MLRDITLRFLSSVLFSSNGSCLAALTHVDIVSLLPSSLSSSWAIHCLSDFRLTNEYLLSIFEPGSDRSHKFVHVLPLRRSAGNPEGSACTQLDHFDLFETV